MRRILFQWRGLTVWSYPAMVYLGLVTGVVAGNVAAHAAGIDAFRVFVATLVLIVPALIGARLSYVASHWQVYRRDLRRIWNRNEGGAAHYGGLAVVLPLSVPLLAALRLPLGAFWDVASFTMLVTLIFGRIGCLMNGCCAGRPSRGWASMYLPNSMGVWEKRIPAQCLEAGWGAILLVSAIAVWQWLPFPGALFLLLTASYASGRLALIATRERHPGAARFAIHYGVSVALIVVSLAALTARWPK
jgi:phosphatidylglycerol---prolipoprotein diacylglyceryl transferase